MPVRQDIRGQRTDWANRYSGVPTKRLPIVPNTNWKTLDQRLLDYAENYNVDPSIMANALNKINQSVWYNYNNQLRQASANAYNGGGKFTRAIDTLGGQAALARSSATSDLLSKLAEMTQDQRMKYLYAYLQKYGIDKEFELGKEKLAKQSASDWFNALGKLGAAIIMKKL